MAPRKVYQHHSCLSAHRTSISQPMYCARFNTPPRTRNARSCLDSAVCPWSQGRCDGFTTLTVRFCLGRRGKRYKRLCQKQENRIALIWLTPGQACRGTRANPMLAGPDQCDTVFACPCVSAVLRVGVSDSQILAQHAQNQARGSSSARLFASDQRMNGRAGCILLQVPVPVLITGGFHTLAPDLRTACQL